jgi:ubiquinone/menaquinone biosynthesis C-methylase UbiE
MVMANRASNQKRNRWTLSLLNIQSNQRVLEIGCGPGWAIAEACRMVPGVVMVGVDPSEVMLRQARSRNKCRNESGQVAFHCCTAEQLPDGFNGSFDCVLSSNVFGFLPAPEITYQRIFSLLTPGGRVATTWLPRVGDKSDDAVVAMASRIESACISSQLMNVDRRFQQFNGVLAVCVVAQKTDF